MHLCEFSDAINTESVFKKTMNYAFYSLQRSLKYTVLFDSTMSVSVHHGMWQSWTSSTGVPLQIMRLQNILERPCCDMQCTERTIQTHILPWNLTVRIPLARDMQSHLNGTYALSKTQSTIFWLKWFAYQRKDNVSIRISYVNCVHSSCLGSALQRN